MFNVGKFIGTMFQKPQGQGGERESEGGRTDGSAGSTASNQPSGSKAGDTKARSDDGGGLMGSLFALHKKQSAAMGIHNPMLGMLGLDSNQKEWEMTKCQSIVKEPAICALAIVSTPCFTYHHRGKLLDGDWEQYVCFGGGTSKYSSSITGTAAYSARAVMKMNPCCFLCVTYPRCAMFMEATCCMAWAINANHRFIQNRFSLEDDQAKGLEGKCGKFFACGGNVAGDASPVCKPCFVAFKVVKICATAPCQTTQHHMQLRHEGLIPPGGFLGGHGVPSMDYIKHEGDGDLPVPATMEDH